jgi:hypothetical protein
MITPDAMLDPAVSLGMLQLDTQLAFAGSGEVASMRDSFDARLASIAPRIWFEALGRKLLTAANEPQATAEQRQAAVDKLRRLTTQLPDSAELQQQLTEAVQGEPLSGEPRFASMAFGGHHWSVATRPDDAAAVRVSRRAAFSV